MNKNKSIKKIIPPDFSEYVKNELNKIPLPNRYPPNFKIRGAHYPKAGGYSEVDTEPKEVATKWMDLTEASANELILWLKDKFRIFEDRYVVLQDSDLVFIGTQKESFDYVKGNACVSLEKALDGLDSSEWKIAHIDNYKNV